VSDKNPIDEVVKIFEEFNDDEWQLQEYEDEYEQEE
jgi:hypothetical protein